MKHRSAACGVAVLLFLVLLSAPVNAQDTVELRGGADGIRGHIIEIDRRGIWIRKETGASITIAWDRVRHVDAEVARHQDVADTFMEAADDVWRARTRVQRGDATLAEPLFAKHFERWIGSDSETSLIIAEGLLRCRLHLAQHNPSARVGAVLPALEVARLRMAGVTTDRYDMLEPIIDDTLYLCPALPPVMVGIDRSDIELLERDLAAYDFHNNETVAMTAMLYLSSMRRDLTHVVIPEVGRHAHLAFMRDLVEVLDSDPDTRSSARNRIERRLASDELTRHGAWVEAWLRYHIGRSLLQEDDFDLQLRGRLHLAYLPAKFNSSQPYLAAIALSVLEQSERTNGHKESADSLLAELNQRYSHYSIHLRETDTETLHE